MLELKNNYFIFNYKKFKTTDKNFIPSAAEENMNNEKKNCEKTASSGLLLPTPHSRFPDSIKEKFSQRLNEHLKSI